MTSPPQFEEMRPAADIILQQSEPRPTLGVWTLTWVKSGHFSVSEQPDRQESEKIEQVNTELTRGLKLCHSLIDDYRTKLGANPAHSDDVLAANDDDSDEDDDSRRG